MQRPAHSGTFLLSCSAMLRLHHISLLQFKNYARRQFQFQQRLVGICGKNGVGKTNLLDAIYYLCFTKSYFQKSDGANVLQGAMGFRLEGNFTLDEAAQKLVCILRETGKKEFYLNEEAYTKMADHVGKIPAVIITPDDVHMITDGSEERRRFLDALLSQIDHSYLIHLMDYVKILTQRNSSLKLMAETRQHNDALLDVYDAQLAPHAEYIFQKRKTLLEELIPRIVDTYQSIAGTDEPIHLTYESQLLHHSFPDLLRQTREKDKIVQRTTAGIHKDELEILLNEQPFKTMASQGQRKSLLFALKLSEFDTLCEEKGFAPLLLLDDVFEKLDEQRMHNLLERVCLQNDGQVFITDTHCERIRQHFERLGNEPLQLIEL